MFLKRLTYPCRYIDMVSRFAKSVPEICMFTNKLQDYVYDTHKVRIIMWNHAILSPQLLQNYPAALQKKGAALGNCFGFVDGTVRPISRSEKYQRILYKISVRCVTKCIVSCKHVWSCRKLDFYNVTLSVHL